MLLLNVCYLTISYDKERGGNLAGWFWFRVSNEVEVQMSVMEAEACLARLRAWLELVDGLPRWFTHILAKWVLDVGRRPQLLTRKTSHGNVWGSWLYLDQLIIREQDGSHNEFYELSSEVTICLFWNVLSDQLRDQLYSMWEGTIQGTNSRRQNSWGLILDAAQHRCLWSLQVQTSNRWLDAKAWEHSYCYCVCDGSWSTLSRWVQYEWDCAKRMA